MSVLEVRNVTYKYAKAKKDVLKGVSMSFEEGKVTAIQGSSGAGKSTLMYLLSGLDVPKEGQVIYNGQPLEKSGLEAYRRDEVSMINQHYLLFPFRTVIENAAFPLELHGVPKKEAEAQAEEILQSLGIGAELWKRFPKHLSGGEQQRVAIARALANKSKVITADEPTGSLDADNTKAVLSLLFSLAHEKGLTVIIITHDTEIAKQCDFAYKVDSGRLAAN